MFATENPKLLPGRNSLESVKVYKTAATQDPVLFSKEMINFGLTSGYGFARFVDVSFFLFCHPAPSVSLTLENYVDNDKQTYAVS